MKNILLIIYAIILLISVLISLIYNSVHHGTLLMFLGAALIIFSVKFAEKTKISWLIKSSMFLSVTFVLLSLCFISYLLISGREILPKEGENPTVIVLGGQVRAGAPSLTLRKRLDIAYEFLEENPESDCVVTGGMGADETETESSVMKAYLVSLGIAWERIFIEDNSHDTSQNLMYANDVINGEDLNQSILIISDGFHLGRAHTTAAAIGFNQIYQIPSDGPIGLRMGYFYREMMSHIKLWFITLPMLNKLYTN